MQPNPKQSSLLTLVGIFFLSAGIAFSQAGTCRGISLGQGANLNGFVPFRASNLWNTDISAAQVDPNSTNIINFIGSSVTLHPDFGAGTFQKQTLGIPYQVVAKTQAKVNVTLGDLANESDPGPEPIPPNALIEGYPNPGNGDRHVLVLEKDGCWLYELYKATVKSGKWSADSTAIWDMTSNEQRPFTWTSADAAGLPVFAGLARYDEVAAGAIHHALRFTVSTTRKAFVLPATHWASTTTDPNAPPMGTRLRLKSSFDISAYPADDQVILTAMKRYGMILADNGSAIFIGGVPDNRWNNTNLNRLKNITASDFEVVQMGTIYTPANVPTGPSPAIHSFTANPSTVSAGSPVTLNWNVVNSIYNIVDPQAGPVRGTSVVVTPSATTTYTLYSTNRYGRTTASVTVTVQ
jgi:hypothetical protein